MADDDFDLYGEDDGFGNPQVQVGLPAFCAPKPPVLLIGQEACGG